MHEILEPVALTRDIPVAGLRCGDNGAPGNRSDPLHHLLDFAQVGECLQVVVRLQHQP
jgi:hypothetical protein